MSWWWKGIENAVGFSSMYVFEKGLSTAAALFGRSDACEAGQLWVDIQKLTGVPESHGK
jgi:hypothetical protein